MTRCGGHDSVYDVFLVGVTHRYAATRFDPIAHLHERDAYAIRDKVAGRLHDDGAGSGQY